MKKLTTLIFILLIHAPNVFTCDCDGDYSYNSEFYHCDAILSGKIVSVFDKTEESYKVKVEINNIYKGDSITEFLVYSSPEDFPVIEDGDTVFYMSDCDIYLRVGEQWLIYADKCNKNIYSFSLCSATKKLNEVSKKELDFLNYNKNMVITNDPKFYKSSELDNPDLVSISMKGWHLILNNISNKKDGYTEINLKIDKRGYIVYDKNRDSSYNKLASKMKKYEPFIPGSKSGEIVNSEYRVFVEEE